MYWVVTISQALFWGHDIVFHAMFTTAQHVVTTVSPVEEMRNFRQGWLSCRGSEPVTSENEIRIQAIWPQTPQLDANNFGFLVWFSLGVFFFFFFPSSFLWPHLWSMEVPGLEGKSEMQPSAYTTAMATSDPSCICELHGSSWQRQTLNPLCEATYQTHILTETILCP